MFIKYPKIKRLGDEDNEGLLSGTVVVQEKIDGANASIWINDGQIMCGSRNRILESGFNGFVDYANNNKGIREYLGANPRHRLYGEWLVRHTIAYNETAYKQFYLFDILITPDEYSLPEIEEKTGMKKMEQLDHQMRDMVRGWQWLTPEQVRNVAKKYKIATPQVFAELKNPTPDVLDEFVGKTALGNQGEGIVLKNFEFVNKWGDYAYAKIVSQEFKEDNAITFGGNNKFSDTYLEMKMVNECMTLARVKKIMHKLQPQIDNKLDMEHTGRIIETAYHDMFEEELWNFVKKHKKIDFGHLQKLAMRKAAKIYHDILNNHISIAYK